MAGKTTGHSGELSCYLWSQKAEINAVALMAFSFSRSGTQFMDVLTHNKRFPISINLMENVSLTHAQRYVFWQF